MLLEMAAEGFGERVVSGTSTTGMTAADLLARARAGAAELRARDARALLYLTVNSLAFAVALFSAAYAGIPFVPLNYRLGDEQLEGLLANHPGSVGISDNTGIVRLAGAGIEGVSAVDWMEITKRTGSVDAAHGGGSDLSDDVAVIIYTSGTTSAPKGVLLRHGNLVSYVIGSVDFATADEGEASLISVPPYHIAAVANVLTNLYAGRRMLVLDAFTPREWLDTVREASVTHALVVPTMLARIVESGGDLSVPSLRSLAYGGAPMPVPLVERALDQWHHVDFVNAYGLTETSSTVTVLGPEEHREAAGSDDPLVRARLASVGRPLPGIELQIRDDDGRSVPAGVEGRICIRGEQVAAEYAGVGRAVDSEGFFDTRDRGHIDEGGYLFVHGRADDTIIRGAENIAPAEIEDVLLRHPAVTDAAVFGIPDVEWGQVIGAALVVRPGEDVDAKAIREFVRGELRSSKTPERVWFIPELPRTDTGKLLRRELIAWAIDEQAQASVQ